MPKDSLVYAVIVCVVILAMLGLVLLILKYRLSRKSESLFSVG